MAEDFINMINVTISKIMFVVISITGLHAHPPLPPLPPHPHHHHRSPSSRTHFLPGVLPCPQHESACHPCLCPGYRMPLVSASPSLHVRGPGHDSAPARCGKTPQMSPICPCRSPYAKMDPVPLGNSTIPPSRACHLYPHPTLRSVPYIH